MRFILAIVFVLFTLLPAFAQDDAEQEKSFFTTFLEEQLSTPNRQIRIANIQGALSSNATIGEITVADREGVWLRIKNASIEWSRTALLLRQRLDISRLAADSIEVSRKPLPEEGIPAPESSGFSVPELPVAVNLEQLEVPSVKFGQGVFGLESEMSIKGNLALEGGSLDTDLTIERLDGPGGQFRLAAGYANDTQQLDLDLSLSEPENGIVANLLEIEGRPPIKLTLQGSGPLDGLDLQLALDAAGERVLEGTAQLRQRDEGLGFTTELSGPIARLVPERYRDFFGTRTAFEASGVARDSGGFLLEKLQLDSAALKLQGAAETSADGFLTALSLDASIADDNAGTVVLPVAGGDTTVQKADLSVTYGEAGSDEWSGRLDIRDLASGTFSSKRIALDMGGAAENLNQPDARRVTFRVEGGAEGIDSEQKDVAEALGETIDLDIEGAWSAGEPVSLETAKLEGNGLSLDLSGKIAEFAFDGDINLDAQSIAPFSSLADRDLSGGATMSARGRIEPVGGAFDLTLNGKATELRIDQATADNLMDGTTRITGRVARGEQGLTTDDLHVANDQLDLTANGTFATGEADFAFDFALSDLALVSEQASGRLTANGRASGSDGRIRLTFKSQVPDGQLAGKTLSNARLGFEGTLQDDDLDGHVSGDAYLDSVRATLESDIAVTKEERRLANLEFSAGGARLTGDLVQDAQGLLDGDLAVDAPDISTAAALALMEASGSIKADVSLSNRDGEQMADASGSVRDLVAQSVEIGSADFAMSAEDLFGVPMVEGTVDGRDIAAGGVDVSRLQARATRSGEQTDFSADAELDNGAALSTAGSLSPQDDGFVLALDKAELTRADLQARLTRPAQIRIEGQNVSFDTIDLDVGGGSLSARGEIAENYDVSLTIRNLPLAVANAVKPDLKLAGTIEGKASVSGPRDKPNVDFDLAARQIAAAALKSAGLSTITVIANGSTSGENLALNANVTSPEGLDASAKGQIPLGDGDIALDVDLAAFPLSVLNAVVKGQDLAGRISGKARIGGTLADPQASFDLDGDRLGAAPLRDIGIDTLQAKASGRFADETVSLSSLTVRGPSGLSVDASGTVPLGGSGLSVDISATAPLSLANPMLVERGATVSGTLTAKARVTGSISDPAIDGSFSTSDAQAVDPESNLRLDSIRVSGSIRGQTVTLDTATASLSSGGSVSISGTVGTDAQAGFPADLRIVLDETRYTDGEMITTTANGNLTLTGALTRDPLLAGQVNLERVEITVPETFGGGANSIDVKHVAPPPGVQRTLERARANDGTPMPSSRPSVLQLDVRVEAPERVFVRGRGLDAELGGSVRVTGPITNVQPVGGFELIRGRVSILGHRITFDEGRITLIGDLDPFVRLVARSQGSDITAIVTIEGRVSDLDISFSSQPTLPQDEVLARLIFDRSISELSPLQLARLAAAAAELAGGSNTSLLDNLRSATGLDNLDIVTDSEGNAAVRAERYIQDNIYLGVEAGAEGETRGTINLDITDNLKAKGAVGSDGDSSVGVFYERDY